MARFRQGNLIISSGESIIVDGQEINEISTDTTLAGNSDFVIPTEKAIKTYVDNNGGGGSGVGASYLHSQTVAASTWIVQHNFRKQYGTVEVIDSSNEVMSPDTITFDDTSQLTITFASPETGYALIHGGGSVVEYQPGGITGVYNLSTGDSTAQITFDDQGNTAYGISLSIRNDVDSIPSTYQYIITNKTTNGFEVILSGVVPTDNYYIEWIVGWRNYIFWN
jgi:hypothetical protein